MANSVVIYGKDTCPYTSQAREDYAKKGFTVQYVNVKADEAKLKEMMKQSKGKRDVPVIVEDGQVSIGYNGGS